MRWTPKAEAAVKKVPFFVRKKVKARVEKKALQAGKPVVELIEIIQWCIDFYKQHSKAGERFAEIFKAADSERLVREKNKMKS